MGGADVLRNIIGSAYWPAQRDWLGVLGQFHVGELLDPLDVSGAPAEAGAEVVVVDAVGAQAQHTTFDRTQDFCRRGRRHALDVGEVDHPLDKLRAATKPSTDLAEVVTRRDLAQYPSFQWPQWLIAHPTTLTPRRPQRVFRNWFG
jgi:hypothetical protein